jgi:alkylated DNA repair protein (DNA oxidative demethylase)
MRGQGREVAPGAAHMPGRLSADEQQAVARLCLTLGREDAGFYRPVARGGHPMSVQMLCLGRHWNARRYEYELERSDVDGRPVLPLPDELRALAQRIGEEAGFTFQPDVCIVNLYGAESRMGLHRDQDESAGSLARGAPVVSLSIGDTARFLFGGLRRRDPVEVVWLESGDAFVFGGPARLRYHGVTRIMPGSGPADIGFAGRLNLTFREY